MPSDGDESDGGDESGDSNESDVDKGADSEDSIHTKRKHLAPPVAMYMTPNHKAPKRRVGQAVSPAPLNDINFLPTPENPPKRKRSLIDKVLRLHNFINTPSARMVRSRFAPLHLNEEDTIAFKLLGKTCASCVNHLYRRRSLMVLSRVAHALGIIASGLTMASLIPSSYAYLTLLSWPRALVLFGVCNADLLKILIQDGNVLCVTLSHHHTHVAPWQHYTPFILSHHSYITTHTYHHGSSLRLLLSQVPNDLSGIVNMVVDDGFS
jgi:hypothetical protein